MPGVPLVEHAPLPEVESAGPAQPLAEGGERGVARGVQVRAPLGIAQAGPPALEAPEVLAHADALEHAGGRLEPCARGRVRVEVRRGLRPVLEQRAGVAEERARLGAPGGAGGGLGVSGVRGGLGGGLGVRGVTLRPVELGPAPPLRLEPGDEARNARPAGAVARVVGEERGGEAAHVERQVLDRGERSGAGDECLVARVEAREIAGGVRALAQRPPVGAQALEDFRGHRGRVGEGLADGLQRPVAGALAPRERVGERLAVVGQQHEVLRRPAHLHVEQRALVQVFAVEHRDDGARGAPLRGVHRRAPGVVEVAELGIGAGEAEARPVLGREAHPLRPDGEHAGGVAVHQRRRPGRGGAVAGPADGVAGAELEGDGVEDPQIARDVARRAEAPRRPVGVGEHHRAVLEAGDFAVVARAAAVGVAVEGHRVAERVAAKLRGLRAGEAPVDQTLDVEHRPVEHALAREPLADGGVDGTAERMRGGEHQRLRAGLVREREPHRAGRLTQARALGLVHPVSKRAQRRPRVTVSHRRDRGGQRRVALAQHLVHHRGRHACALEHPEGLARIDRAELAGVAEQHRAGHTQALGDAKERGHLRGADHRGLVQHQHRAGVVLPRPGEALSLLQRLEAREEGLERAGLDARPLAERAHRGGRRREPVEPGHAGKPGRCAQHRGLARARVPLHPDEPVRGAGDGRHRLALAPGEGDAAREALRYRRSRQRPAYAACAAHRRQQAPLRANRRLGHERALVPPRVNRLDQRPVSDQPRYRRIDLGQRVAPRRSAERERAHLRLGQQRPALVERGHRAAHRLQHPALGSPQQLRRGGGLRPGRSGPLEVHIGRERRQRRGATAVADNVGGQLRRRDPPAGRPAPRLRIERPGRARLPA